MNLLRFTFADLTNIVVSKSNALAQIILTWIVIFRLPIFLFGHVDIVHVIAFWDIFRESDCTVGLFENDVDLLNGLLKHLTDLAVVQHLKLHDVIKKVLR